jgi:cation transport regulator ChaC
LWSRKIPFFHFLREKRKKMAESFEEKIASCAIFDGCSGVEAIPSSWRDADGQLDQLVVFGYGSVIWKPGIEFDEAHVGYINGFVRRMWQGNETHRGRKGCPGRVATLIPKPNKRTFGKAFVLKTKEQIAAAMDHLIMREISLGGYCLGFTPFFPIDGGSSTNGNGRCNAEVSRASHHDPLLYSAAVPALVFSATTENEFYLGPEKMSSMAETIATTDGPSGHNVEYLVKICDFMRNELPPEIDDNHLFRLEKLTLECLAERGLNYKPLAYPELFEIRENVVNENRRVHSICVSPPPPPRPRSRPNKSKHLRNFPSTAHQVVASLSQSGSTKVDQDRDDIRKELIRSSNPTNKTMKKKKSHKNGGSINLFFYAQER